MGFWRKEDPILGEPNAVGIRPVLSGGMFPSQREWWDLPNFIRLLVGGYGSGKTKTNCGKWSIAMALHNAPAPHAIVSPNFPLARKTVIPTLEELLEGKSSVRKDLKWKHNKGDHSFSVQVECGPPGLIYYMSGDIPDNLKGPNLGSASIDEPFIQERAVFDQMVARCRDPRAKLHAIGLSGTPEELNWGYEIAEGADAKKYDLGIVHMDTRENIALPPKYSDNLIASMDEKTMAAYVKGLFVSLSSGRVFYSFEKDRNVKRQDGNGAVWFAGMDFNVNPMAFVVGWHRGQHVHIEEEFELPNSDTQYACSIIREKHGDKVRMVFPDPSGRSRHTNAPGGVSDFTWIERAKFIVMAPHEAWPRRDSFNAVNAKLFNGTMTIDPGCVKLCRYMMEHTHERMNKQKQMTHLLDATRYPITYLFPVYKPTSAVSEVRGL